MTNHSSRSSLVVGSVGSAELSQLSIAGVTAKAIHNTIIQCDRADKKGTGSKNMMKSKKKPVIGTTVNPLGLSLVLSGSTSMSDKRTQQSNRAQEKQSNKAISHYGKRNINGRRDHEPLTRTHHCKLGETRFGEFNFH